MQPTGRRQRRVLNALQKALSAAEQGHGDAFVCATKLQHPEVGGNRWAARMFELRQQGWPIVKVSVCYCDDCRHRWRRQRQRGETPTIYSAWRLASDDLEVTA